MKSKEVTVVFRADTNELDKAIKKAKQLLLLAKEINGLDIKIGISAYETSSMATKRSNALQQHTTLKLPVASSKSRTSAKRR